MSLDTAQDEFRSKPDAETARTFANELLDYWRDGMVGNDTLREGLIEIVRELTGGRSDLGSAVKVEVKSA